MGTDSFFQEDYQNFKIFWEDYLSTTEAKITGPLGTIFWILSGVWLSTFAYVALVIHVVPITYHYFQNRPFGIEFQFTPIRSKENIPDLISAEEEQAILKNGQGRIHAKVELSKSISTFAIQFDTDNDTVVELRDIPEPEHIYDRDKNLLRSNSVSSRRFQLVLDVFDYSNHPSNRGELSVIDIESKNTITKIELIRA